MLEREGGIGCVVLRWGCKRNTWPRNLTHNAWKSLLNLSGSGPILYEKQINAGQMMMGKKMLYALRRSRKKPPLSRRESEKECKAN